MAKFNQFLLLLWKNFILQKRRPIATVVELLLPILFSFLLVVIRSQVETTNHPNRTVWDSFTVDNLPSFKSDVLPSDRTWNIAYVPNISTIDNVMLNVEDFLNDIPKSPLEKKCPGLSLLISSQQTDGSGAGDGGMSLDNLPPGALSILTSKAQTAGMPLQQFIMAHSINGTMDQLMAETMAEFSAETIECIKKNLDMNTTGMDDFPGSTGNMTGDVDMANQTQQLLNLLFLVPGVKVVGFESEESFDNYIKEDDALAKTLCGVIFTKYETGSDPRFSYRIRPHSDPVNVKPGDSARFTGNPDTWNTNRFFPLFQVPGPREPTDKYGGKPGYYSEGFLSVMHAVDMGILAALKNTTIKKMGKENLALKRFPYPPYIEDTFLVAIQRILPLLLMLSFFYTALIIVKSIVHEKETKMKEYLMMTGLPNWLHWLAWFIKYILFMAVSCIIICILYKIELNSKRGTVLTYSDGSAIFLFLVTYAAATICFCFMVSVFFSKANVAAAAGGVLYGLSYMPYLFIASRYSQMSFSQKALSSLLSNVAMANGAQLLSMFEGKGTGIQWSNMGDSVSVDDNFTFLHVIFLLLLDCFLYCIIAWYVEAVFPGEYGIPKPWNFLFTKTYWLGPKKDKSSYEAVSGAEGVINGVIDPSSGVRTPGTEDSEYFESEPPDMRRIVHIDNLKKIFNPGPKEKVAVDGLTLSMYEGQITVLLGHNGAGKTTTMSILTGLYPSTSGSATVMGHDITTDMELARRSMGLCPQHNILFDQLTVDEHLYFFARLKGYNKKEAEEECRNMCEILQLADKRKAQSRTLSGGMKRKLSVGLALCAGSKFIVLDEPTAGMDPAARRAIWDVVQHYRDKCSMLLSTHFMDEADLLGDRISIMAEGKLRCAGSSVFLKNKFGVGYHVVMNKTPACNVEQVEGFFQSRVPESKMERTSAAEVSFLLPFESSHLFFQLFTDLDSSKENLGILSYGASITTMEEVFLCVTEDASVSVRESSRRLSFTGDEKPSGLFSSPSMSDRDILQSPEALNVGATLWFQQFQGLVVKRILHFRRHLKVIISQLLVPIIFVIIAILNAKFAPFLEKNIRLDLSLAGYGLTRVAYESDNSPGLAQAYVDSFAGIANTKNVPGDMEVFLADEYEREGGSFSSGNVIAATWKSQATNESSNIAWFNAQAYHSPANTILYSDQAYMRWKLGQNFSLQVFNDPLPRNSSNRVEEQLVGSISGFMIAFNVVMGFSFLSASFAIFLVRERTDRAALLQMLAGVDPFCFWLSAFVWDFVNFFLPCIACTILFAIFGVTEYIDDGHIWITLLLFALYCWSALPMTYLMSLLFSVPATALVTITIFGAITGLATIITVNVLMIIDKHTRAVADDLDWVFLLLPQYCIGQGLADFYTNNKMVNICTSSPIYEYVCEKQGITYQTNYLAWEPYGVGRYAAFMAWEGVAFFLILFGIEYDMQGIVIRLFRRIRANVNMRRCSHFAQKYENVGRGPEVLLETEEQLAVDDDVTKEQMRIQETPYENLAKSDLIYLKKLRKVYKGKKGGNVKNLVAVNNLSVGIPRGQCFGLLGINGAGKTTTFKMLTGDVRPTSGTAFLDGCSVTTNLKQAQQNMGYCPQFDGLIEQMTGEESLVMYARLRGVKEKHIKRMVANLGELLNFTGHIKKLCGNYSGGNKRKLSTAIALIGGPPVVLLDEPSTGMDPGARRKMWDTISRICTEKRCVIITSHSMEECEALCTRLAIMVNGQLRCLGSPQHLKNKFGQGYSVEVKMESNDGDPQPVKDYMQTNFPGTIIKDEHQGLIAFQVPNNKPSGEELSLATIFGCMEDAKRQLNLRDYSVSQTTLEQVFLSFARRQRESTDC